jgi:hypothetical protein
MLRAIKDTNTGAVYDWVKQNDDGTVISINIPRDNWKKEQEWTTEEIDALFAPKTIKPKKTKKEPQPQEKVVDDTVFPTTDQVSDTN